MSEMQTFVAVINGSATLAYRARDIEEAKAIAKEEDGEIQMTLFEFTKADGSDIWDGVSEIEVRPATSDENDIWAAGTKDDEATAASDPGHTEDDPDDFYCFLVDVVERDFDEGTSS
jgi:hypothetical protein